MTFNIIVVAFDKEPDMSDETLLDYRGFDAVLVGKETHGQIAIYATNSAVPGVKIRHAQFRDEATDSPNLVVVFENALPERAVSSDEMSEEQMNKTVDSFKEIMLEMACCEIERIEGPFIANGVLAYCLLDVREVLTNKLADASRRQIKSV